MTFDWTISVGNLFVVAGFAASGVMFVAMIRSDVRLLSQRVGAAESILKELSANFIEFAKQEGRFEGMEQRLNIVSHRLDEHISQANSERR